MKKVSVIGAGHVGATCTYYIAEKNFADIVMIDVVEGMPQAKGMDFSQAAPLRQYGVTIRGSNDYREIADSDVVVITAGIPRKPGMDRMDLLRTNAEIVGTAARHTAAFAPNSTIVVVSNPLDIMCTVALEASGFALKRVMGMAGILDSTRFRYFVAEKLGVAVTDVHAMVLGGHGDTMVPLPRFTTVAGIPITKLMSAEEVEAIHALIGEKTGTRYALGDRLELRLVEANPVSGGLRFELPEGKGGGTDGPKRHSRGPRKHRGQGDGRRGKPRKKRDR